MSKEILSKALKTIPIAAREGILQYIKKHRVENLEALLKDFHKVLYLTTPVDMWTFINDPYYLNLKGQVYHKIEDDLCELFSPDNNYQEAVLTGGIGYGKSTFSEIALCRMVYEASCYRNPQSVYGLMEGTMISFVNCSLDVDKAESAVFHGIKEKLSRSEYFNKHLTYFEEVEEKDNWKRKNRYKPNKRLIRFPNNITIFPTNNPISLNVFGGILDEVNFMQFVQQSKRAKGGVYDQAKILHDGLRRRMKSRFMKRGKLPGILISISSARYPNDFTEKMIEESEENKSIFVRRYSQWETKPKSFFIGKYFKISLGDGGAIKPEIIKGNKEEAEKRIKALKEKNVKILSVPLEYYVDFKTDLYGSIRDIAGYATISTKHYIKQREKIYEAIKRAMENKREHPFNLLTTTLKDGLILLKENLKVTSSPRFLHIDLSKNRDSCGFAMGHVSHYKTVFRRDDKGVLHEETAVYIVFDILLKIVPTLGGEIEYSDIRNLIYRLKKIGFWIACISLDGFQSVDFMQILKKRGFTVEYLSIDRTQNPYDAYKMALYEDRIEIYDYPPLIDETKELEEDNILGKIDHPPGGSKDIADCVAGVCYHCVTKKPSPIIATELGEMEGSEDAAFWVEEKFDKEGKLDTSQPTGIEEDLYNDYYSVEEEFDLYNEL